MRTIVSFPQPATPHEPTHRLQETAEIAEIQSSLYLVPSREKLHWIGCEKHQKAPKSPGHFTEGNKANEGPA
jgi:hypothetical protein